MIRRPPAPTGVVLVPRWGRREFPAWAPVRPRRGWTPASARTAAQSYAEGADGLSPRERRMAAEAAFHALRLADRGLSRATLRERLDGGEPAAPQDDRPPF